MSMLTVNDTQRLPTQAQSAERLLSYLRYSCGLVGTKEGCGQGFCGACVVLVQERRGSAWKTVNSCLLTVGHAAAFHAIRTIESPGFTGLQRQVVRMGATQCGFCTPGQILNLSTMGPEADAGRFDGHVCRCTGYGALVQCVAGTAPSQDIEDLLGGVAEDPPRVLPLPLGHNLRVVAGDQGNMLPFVPVSHQPFLDVRYLAGMRTIVYDSGTDRLTVGGSCTLSEVAAAAPPGLRSHIECIATHPVRNTGTLVGNMVLAREHGLNFDSVAMLAATGATLTRRSLDDGAETTCNFDDWWSEETTGVRRYLITSLCLQRCSAYVAHRDARRSRACGADAIVATTNPKSGPYYCMRLGRLSVDDSACDPFIRKIQMGLPSYATNRTLPTTEVLVHESGDPLGVRLLHEQPKYEARAQARGEAIFTADTLPPDSVFCAYVLATGMGRLEYIEGREHLEHTTRVLAAPVDGLSITYSDWNNEAFVERIMVPVGTIPLYRTQPVAVVLAPTLDQARREARRLRPVHAAVGTSLRRRAHSHTASSVPPPWWWWWWPVHVTGTTRTLEGTCRTGSQKHMYIEPQTVSCVPGPLDTWVISVSSQDSRAVQAVAAGVLGVPLAAVRVQTTSVGGAFGGKLDRHLPHVALACFAARSRQEAVANIVLSAQDMAMTGGRPAMEASFTARFVASTGRLLGLRCRVVLAGGSIGPYAGFLVHGIHELLVQWYQIREADIHVEIQPTDDCVRTTARGPGVLEALFIAESVMDQIASETGLDPLVVRAHNLVRSPGWTPLASISRGFGNGFRSNLPAEVGTLQTFWAAAMKRHRALKPAVERFNQQWAGRRRRALSVTPTFFTSFRRPATARVAVLADGSIQVAVDGMELGQGLRTKVREAVVRAVVQAFPFPLDRRLLQVRVLASDTDGTPNPFPTGGNTSTESACIAATLATVDVVWWVALWAYLLWAHQYVGWYFRWVAAPLARYLGLAYADVFVGARGTHWVAGAGLVCRTPYFSRSSSVRTPAQVYGSNPLGVHNTGMALHEVEVDLIAGEVDVLRAELWCETGDSLHHSTDAGQVQGAYMMGLGAVLLEDEKQGQHADWWSYKVPLASDCPRSTVIRLYTQPESVAFWRSYKSVGEPPLAGAIGIISAIRQCLPPRCPTTLDLPVTSRQVRAHLASSDKETTP